MKGRQRDTHTRRVASTSMVEIRHAAGAVASGAMAPVLEARERRALSSGLFRSAGRQLKGEATGDRALKEQQPAFAYDALRRLRRA